MNDEGLGTHPEAFHCLSVSQKPRLGLRHPAQ
jgi:hypothetical protein